MKRKTAKRKLADRIDEHCLFSPFGTLRITNDWFDCREKGLLTIFVGGGGIGCVDTVDAARVLLASYLKAQVTQKIDAHLREIELLRHAGAEIATLKICCSR